MSSKTLPLPLEGSSAVFSEDGVYRYELRRRWAAGDLVLWVMLNPSTADEFEDDPTIRRCIGFSRRWGFGGIVVCNLFAHRSTDPKVLKLLDYPEGPENWRTIRKAATECSKTVCGWGAHGAVKCAGRKMVKRLQANGCAPQCLGTTKSGQPKHPLYIPYSQDLIALSVPNP